MFCRCNNFNATTLRIENGTQIFGKNLFKHNKFSHWVF